MVSFRSASGQAQHAARSLTLPSQGTERNYQQALKGCAEFLRASRLGDLRTLTVDKAIAYLDARSLGFSQKTIDMDRQAMEAVIGKKLPIIKSELNTILASRAYSHEQAKIVAGAQREKYSLSTLIAEGAGLRAHELLTLRLSAERQADTHREYRPDRFEGCNDFVIYTVEGKGGLCREVAVDRALAEQLELRRLPKPRTVYDRKIGYRQHYDIGGGKKWSDSFSKASQRALGWTNGAHGVRHSYAQNRMNKLQEIGYSYLDALEIVSQEMGHFRSDITLTYLR